MAYSYLVENDEALFLVDGGMLGTGRRILRRIAQLGRRPEELLFALVTHGHIDHFGGLAEVQEASGCAILCHPSHVETIRTGKGIVSPGLNFWGKAYEIVAGRMLPKLKLPKLRRVFAAENGLHLHLAGFNGTVLHTPGHSSGDLTLLLDDGSAFVGDLVQGRRIPRVTPPEFSIMAVDEGVMIRSWRALLQSGAKKIYPGHGNPVSIAELLPVFARRSRKAKLGKQLSAESA